MLIMDSTRRRFLHYDFKFYSYWISHPYRGKSVLDADWELEVYLFQWSFKGNGIRFGGRNFSFCIFVQYLHLGNILLSSKCHLFICSLGIHLDRDTPNIHFQDEHELWTSWFSFNVHLESGGCIHMTWKCIEPYWNCHKGYYEHRLSWPKKQHVIFHRKIIQGVGASFFLFALVFDTVDGWNPAPPGMYETL